MVETEIKRYKKIKICNRRVKEMKDKRRNLHR